MSARIIMKLVKAIYETTKLVLDAKLKKLKKKMATENSCKTRLNRKAAVALRDS